MGLITRRWVRHLKRLSKSFNDQRETLMKVAVFGQTLYSGVMADCWLSVDIRSFGAMF